MVRVKICGLTKVQDALQCLHHGADALGWVLEPSSSRYCRELSVPAQVRPYLGLASQVAVFGPLPRALTLEAFDLVQSVDPVPPALGKRGILSIRPQEGESVDALLNRAQRQGFVVLDTYDPNSYGGTGRRLDWSLAAEFVARFPGRVMMAGGLTPDNVAQAIRRVRPYAVDVASGVESQPGIKDPELVAKFIEAAKSA